MGLLSRMSRAATALTKYYFPFTWRNKPSLESPINEVHLNHMEDGINEMDNRILLLAQDKADAADMANVIIDFTMDDTTGVMTFTRFDGSTFTHDTAVEKIALNCYLEGDNFVLELADGTKQRVSLSKFIDTYTFSSTDTVRITANGKNISADIPDGKITLAKLEPTIMSTIRQYTLDAQTAKGVAEQAASTAQGWAIGGTGFEGNNAKYYASKSQRYAVGGVEEGDAKDNAKAYCEAAKGYAEQCQGVSEFDGTAATVSAVDTQGININTATGTTQVTVSDAWEAPIPGLEIAGKSEQGADPSPDNPQEIVSTDVTAVTVKNKNLTGPLENGSVDASGNEADDKSALRSGWISINPGKTYTFSRKKTFAEESKRCMGRIYDIDKNFLGSVTIFNNTELKKVISNSFYYSGARYIRLVQFKGNDETYDGLDLQMEEGDTVTDYEPPMLRTAAITLTEPLRGIGDVRDRIMCRNGMWGVERAINQVDNTGTVPISEALEILATPAWEPLPAATQSALNALTTYTGQTTITVTADGPESDITMQYYGQPGAKTNVQSMLDALARKVALELVSNTDLAVKLADYVAQTDIVQVESTATNKVPSSAYLKQVKDSIDSNLASIGTGTQLAALSMDNKTMTGISFKNYKTIEIMVIIQQTSNGNMFFNFTLVPLVSHILNETRYIAIPGKSYGYCANVLLSINYSAGTVTLMEVDVNTGFTLNAIYILGLK